MQQLSISSINIQGDSEAAIKMSQIQQENNWVTQLIKRNVRNKMSKKRKRISLTHLLPVHPPDWKLHVQS